jgi:hypothetical protein
MLDRKSSGDPALQQIFVAAIAETSITKCFDIFLDVQQIRRAK